MTAHVDTAPALRSQRLASPWDRLAPLSGVAFFVLLLVSAVAAGKTPAEGDSGTTVVSIFEAHATAEKLSSLVAALAVVFLVFFAGLLRRRLQDGGADALAAVAFGGAVVVAAGGAARAGIGWALASGHADLEPGTAQALNVLFSSHYPAIVGIAVLMFAAWGSILRTRALPAWLGWAALPVALLAIAPPTLVPLLGAGVWIAVAGVVMARADERA